MRIAVLASLLPLVLGSACRKAEPDEIVSGPRTNVPSNGGGAGLGSGGVPGFGGTDGLGAAGSMPSELECETEPRVVAGPFTKARLLEAAAECAMSHYCRFGHAAEQLAWRGVDYALEPGEEQAAAVRQRWVEATLVWEEAEIFRFGPAAPAPQGRDLRDLIYAWPRDVRCKVDEQTVNRFYASDLFFGGPADSFVTGRSLAALEYLLFYPGTNNACTQFSAINANGSWAALVSNGELGIRKAAYAGRAAEDVLSSAKALIDAWDPDQGNYYAELVGAGGDDSDFADEQAALNAVNYGLFYLEKEVKDLKLAIPMGLSMDCPTASCPERIESVLASGAVPDLANRQLRANLAGFRRLFQGCGPDGAGLGFDDWLREVGASEVADRMLEALDDAEAKLAGLDTPLQQAVVSSPDRVQTVYDAIKAITDPLKSEVITALNLELPGPSIGDND